MQGSNIDDELRAQGFTLEGGLDHVYDANISVGGPVLRDRVWFYSSFRKWANFNKLPGITNKDGSQAIDDTTFGAFTARGTTQLGNTRITGSYGWHPRDRPGYMIEQLNGAPEAFNAYPNRPYLVQVRATSTLTPRLLLETGYTRNFWHAELQYPPACARPRASSPGLSARPAPTTATSGNTTLCSTGGGTVPPVGSARTTCRRTST